MNSFLKILITVPTLLANTVFNGQIKNAKSVTVKISGNCEMCKKTIETAANVKHTASLDWNETTKMANISYDPNKTSPDEILKRVAYAGYDNEKYLAPELAYAKLPGCCKYERSGKKTSRELVKTNTETGTGENNHTIVTTSINPFTSVYDSYFDLKNALIKADVNAAALKASALAADLSKIDMNKLEKDQHSVWMKVYKSLIASSENISKSKDIEHQRNQFMALSEKMHDLVKVAKLDVTVYYQHCPMYNDGKGANWLSVENTVKNPYYGSQMLSCGKTIETIK